MADWLHVTSSGVAKLLTDLTLHLKNTTANKTRHSVCDKTCLASGGRSTEIIYYE